MQQFISYFRGDILHTSDYYTHEFPRSGRCLQLPSFSLHLRAQVGVLPNSAAFWPPGARPVQSA